MVPLFPRYSQETRLLKLSTPLGPDKLLVECLHGEEALSANYALQVSLLSHDAKISLRSLLGQPVLLELLTAIPDMKWRPFHGHVTAIESVGANGGFARYTMTIAPWTAFLAVGRDSRILQDKTVCEIIDAVFQGYWNQGTLRPDWRWDLWGRDKYPVRSLTCQYQESDFDFASRLLHEEGLFYYFEHTGKCIKAPDGRHTMVIADNNGSFKANCQTDVRFTRSGAVMREDSIDRWRMTARVVVENVTMRSWDYRTCQAHPVQASTQFANATSLATHDAPGAYAFPTFDDGQRVASNQLQAHQVARDTHAGAGTVRTLASGTTMRLLGHPQLDKPASDDARRFTIVRVRHLAYNNLSAELSTSVTHALGAGPLDGKIGMASRPLYRNHFDAIPANVPYRSRDVDGHGVRLHPKPTIHGQQTAIVVGPPGAVVHTDRDHRIKVQFHWQRNAGAAFVSGRTTSLTAGQAVNLVAQGKACHAVKDGISLFTYGKVVSTATPNQETGIKLHAASGKVSSQSQAGATRLVSHEGLMVASVTKSVTVAAKTHVLLTAQGACIRLEGGNIAIHAPGQVDFKATAKELAGPADGSITQKQLPKAKHIFNEAFVVLDEETRQPLPFVRYQLVSSGGVTVEGLTDELGRTKRLFTNQSEQLTLHLLKDE